MPAPTTAGTPDNSRLTVTFTQKPDWIDCPTIERQLREAVRICGGTGE